MSKKESVGSIIISLAPLEGVTDRVFRSCFYRHFGGLDTALTPFLPVPDNIKRVPARVFADVALPGEDSVLEIPQVLVSREESFLTVGKALEKAGYREVNWNLGCPSKGVVRKRKGSGLMPYTDQILRILDRALSDLNLDISLKIRTGFDSPLDSHRLLKALKGYPLKEIICHPRMGVDMYGGSPDLEQFGLLAEITDHPLVYNGDINSLEDYVKLKGKFPYIDRWMIGRGLLKDPFLAERIRSGKEVPAPASLENDRFREFLISLIKNYRQTIPLEHNRVNWMKGILHFSLIKREGEVGLRESLKRLDSEKDFILFLNRLFQ